MRDWINSIESPTILFLWWALLVILIGYLAGRFINFIQNILTKIYTTFPNNPRWRITILQAVTWIFHVIIWIYILGLIGSRIGVHPALIAGIGTVFGAAVGFGSQEIIRDIVKGAVNLLERQFAVGDFIALTVNGVDYMGTVRDVSLRTITIATENDGLVTVPQGFISVVKNYSTDNGSFVLSLPFSTKEKIPPILDILKEVSHDVNTGAEQLHEWVGKDDSPSIRAIQEVMVRGVSEVSGGNVIIQIIGTTWPGKQFAAKRIMLKAISHRLDEAGITFMPYPALSTQGTQQ